MVQSQVASIDFSTAATQTVITAGTARQRIVVYGFGLVNGVATGQGVQFKSGANNLSGVMQLPNAIGGMLGDRSADASIALFYTDPGVALTMSMSAATQVGGYISYKYS